LTFGAARSINFQVSQPVLLTSMGSPPE
jgi:hypothetical protein